MMEVWLLPPRAGPSAFLTSREDGCASLVGGLTSEFFAGRVRGQCEGVDAAGQFSCDELIDHPVAVDAGDAGKFFRDDQNSKVALSSPRRGAMPGVFFALIDDIEADWFESDHEFLSQLAFK